MTSDWPKQYCRDWKKMTETLLITGASRGIGAAIVRRLVTDGSAISSFVLLARKSGYFDEMHSELQISYPNKNFIKVEADVGDCDALGSAMASIRAQGINPTHVINNAGYTNPRSINEVEVEDFIHTLKANLIAPFVVVQELVKHGLAPKTIINVASTAGISGRPGWLTYSASKAGLINMTDVMRQELKVYGTRVVCISPGRCATDLRRILAPDEDPATIMQPSDVADIVSVLLSNVGRLIDSQNLVVRT